MGLLCLIIVIWALADGSVTSLLVVFGILVVLGLLTSNPVVGLFIVLAIILYALFYKEETKDNNKDEIVNQTNKNIFDINNSRKSLDIDKYFRNYPKKRKR